MSFKNLMILFSDLDLNEGQIYEKVNKIDMNGLQDLQEELFLDIQNIIQELGEITSLESLLQEENLIRELSEKTTFLKLSQAFNLPEMLSVAPNATVHYFENVEEKSEILTQEDSLTHQILPEIEEENPVIAESEDLEEVIEEENLELSEEEIPSDIVDEEIVEETEVEKNLDEEDLSDDLDISDNEMFKDDDAEELVEDLTEEIKTPSFEAQEESHFSFAMEKPKTEEPAIKAEEIKETFVSEISISEHSETTSEERISEKEKAFLESEARRKEIVEQSKQHVTLIVPETVIPQNVAPTVEEIAAAHEKKIKLANIKGITKTLFDDEHLDKIISEEKVSHPDSGSLIKSNMPKEYMEAPKPKPEFRLDLNDKIAFTQHLFNNSQMDLNHVVNRLNSYDNLEDAKEFLSDLYYERNWEKVDTYAQRLWILVENRFL